MAATYVGSPIFRQTLLLPSPADPATAASVNTQAFKFLQDTAQWTKERIEGNGHISCGSINVANDVEAGNDVIAQNLVYGQVGISTDGYLRYAGRYFVTLGQQVCAANNWTFVDGSPMLWRQSDVSTPGGLVFGLNPPAAGCRLRRVGAALRGDITNGGAGAHSALPTMPHLHVFAQGGGFAPDELADVVDPSASVGAYDGLHTIVTSDLNHLITGGQTYFVRVRGEWQTNSIANALGVYSIQVEWSDVTLGVP